MTERGLKASSAIAILLACVAVLGAQQADRVETEALARRAADRLRALRTEADRLASDERTLLGDLRRLELEREIKDEELQRVELEAAGIATELAALDRQAVSAEDRLRLDTPQLRSRLVSLYKLGRGRNLRLLLSTSDVRRIGQAARLVAALAAQDERQVTAHQENLAALARTRDALRDRQARLTSLKTAAEQARADADRSLAARNQFIREIDERRDLNARLSGELLGAQQKLQAALADLATGAAAAPRTALPIGPFRGDLAWPAAGNVRQAFGRAAGGRGTAANGIDIAAAEGSPAQAVHDGTVVFSGPFAGFGELVIVEHDRQAFSLYGNLKDLRVERGATVARGATLGLVGVAPTGAAGLYFELRVDGRPVDPLQWLGKR